MLVVVQLAQDKAACCSAVLLMKEEEWQHMVEVSFALWAIVLKPWNRG